MPKDLPGFFWDSERNRYFSIKAGPAPPPRATAQQPPQPAPGDVTAPSTRRRRRSIWKNIQLATISLHEHQRALVRHDITNSQYVVTASVKEQRLPIFGLIRNFVSTTTDSGQLYRLIGDSLGWVYSISSSDDGFEQSHSQWTVEMNISSESEISSVHICDSYSLVTSFGPLSKMRLQKLDDPNYSFIISLTEFHDIRCSHLINRNEIVIGAKQCAAQILDVFDRPRTRTLKTHSDVFSIARQQDLVYAGTRNGSIHRFDLRVAGSRGARGLYTNIPQSTVLHMEIINDTQLLTSYMNGELLMYDIRYIRRANPLLRFMGHVNTHTPRLGIAVDAENDFLFAAGQDRRIRGWSLRTGDCLAPPPVIENKGGNGSPVASNPLLAVFDEPVETMQITKEKIGPCLWVGHSDRLHQFYLGAQGSG